MGNNNHNKIGPPFKKNKIAAAFPELFSSCLTGEQAGIFTPQPAVPTTLDAAAPLQPEGKAGYISRQQQLHLLLHNNWIVML